MKIEYQTTQSLEYRVDTLALTLTLTIFRGPVHTRPPQLFFPVPQKLSFCSGFLGLISTVWGTCRC